MAAAILKFYDLDKGVLYNKAELSPKRTGVFKFRITAFMSGFSLAHMVFFPRLI